MKIVPDNDDYHIDFLRTDIKQPEIIHVLF